MIESNLEVVAANYVLGKSRNKTYDIYDIADAFVAAGETNGCFFEIVVLGRDARASDTAPLFEQALKDKGIRIPTRGEAAVVVVKDYLCAMLKSGNMDVYLITRDLYDLVTEAETDDQDRVLSVLHVANEACDYPPTSKVHQHYKAEFEKDVRALCSGP